MVIYAYKHLEESTECSYSDSFEYSQSISDEALIECPECKMKVQRVIHAVGFKMGKKNLLSDKNIKKNGFTKLVNEGNGKFRKI